MKIKLILAVSALFAVLQLSAKIPASISGLVKDNSNNPIQSVTVSLLKAADSSLVKADISDKTGSFSMELISTGKFLLSYSIVGFKLKKKILVG